MNSLVVAFVIIGIVGSILVVVFSEEIRAVVLDVLIKITSENTAKPPEDETPQNGAPPQRPTEPPWIPPNFIGPSGEPRIIGPKSNPPNY
jgi:hypothetical protein